MSKDFRAGLIIALVTVSVSVVTIGCWYNDDESDGGLIHEQTSSNTDRLGRLVTSSTADTQKLSNPPVFPIVSRSDPLPDPPKIVDEDLKIVWEVWQHLHKDYVDKSKLDRDAFAEFAIRGMLTVLEDAQTSYVKPEVMKTSFGDVFKGKFEGIGAHVSMNLAGEVVIVAPIEGSPAETAGIKPGDKILEADGKSLEGLSLLEAVALIRGPKGTFVTLLVKHLGAIDPVEIRVKRSVIPLISVFLRSEPGATFSHIRISNFYPTTVDDLRNMLIQIRSENSKGLILDLRGNPGGTLDSAISIASEFLRDGLILYDLDGNGKRTNWGVRGGGLFKDIPMVVLVNSGSASSSEVVAGALQDHKRAKVIGAKTFGKGSINILRVLSNEGGLYITISNWYTPLGRLIEGKGITPDIEIDPRDSRDADVQQLERAIKELEQITGLRNVGNEKQ